MPTRRQFLATSATLLLSSRLRAAESKLPPFRVITKGPRHHWFAYYDKLQFDPTSRFALGMGVDFEHRSPTPEDKIEIGMVDLEDHDRWIPLGHSTAWCWQQGCMLQWIPGSSDTVLWNDREGGDYVCRILNVKTNHLRTIPHPIYALSPDGKHAIATDFRRLGHCRPGYGYNGIPDPNFEIPLPSDTGIFRIDLETGNRKLLISIADMKYIGKELPSMKNSKRHWFNHLLYNTNGSRFVFLHRWETSTGGRETQMITADPV
ncbi:MAG: hypothetical protein KDA68_01915, partial [Planctomycetaceae bacterium]|nr:hypothetical protein [Planctomycetaceae bacterium]